MAIEQNIGKGVGKAADEFGAELVKRLQRGLIDNKKLATGSLIGEMSYEVKTDSQGRSIVRVFTQDYFRFVDQGRRPGKQPPLEPIKQWTRIKLIPENMFSLHPWNLAVRGLPVSFARFFHQVSCGKADPGHDLQRRLLNQDRFVLQQFLKKMLPRK